MEKPHQAILHIKVNPYIETAIPFKHFLYKSPYGEELFDNTLNSIIFKKIFYKKLQQEILNSQNNNLEEFLKEKTIFNKTFPILEELNKLANHRVELERELRKLELELENEINTKKFTSKEEHNKIYNKKTNLCEKLETLKNSEEEIKSTKKFQELKKCNDRYKSITKNIS